MDCSECREQLVPMLEGAATAAETASATAHLGGCIACQAALEQLTAIRARLAAAAAALPAAPPADLVMDRIAAARAAAPGASVPVRRAIWLPGSRLLFPASRFLLPACRAFLSSRLGAAALVAAAALVIAAVLLRQPTYAWSMQESIAAASGLDAIYVKGAFGGGAPLELWARKGPDGMEAERLLIRMADGVVVWTEGNKTNVLDPRSGIVHTDDAVTAGFSTWPGPELFRLVERIGFRETDRRRDFWTGHQVVAVESSFVDAKGPESFRLEFDTTTKLLVGLRHWTNLDRRGAPAFESSTITHYQALPDDAFAVNLPPGVRYELNDVRVPDTAIGALAMPGYGIEVPGLAVEDAGRQLVSEMWGAVVKSDFGTFRRLCPVAAGMNDEFLKALLHDVTPAREMVEVLDVERGVLRGHSSLGPLTVVSSRVRRRDGSVHEVKVIVQHLASRPTPTCVVYAGYGYSYRLTK